MCYFPTREAAEAALVAEGFTLTDDGKFWMKRGRVDDFYGGHWGLSLVTVQHNRVAPEYNRPDYYTFRWH